MKELSTLHNYNIIFFESCQAIFVCFNKNTIASKMIILAMSFLFIITSPSF